MLDELTHLSSEIELNLRTSEIYKYIDRRF